MLQLQQEENWDYNQHLQVNNPNQPVMTDSSKPSRLFLNRGLKLGQWLGQRLGQKQGLGLGQKIGQKMGQRMGQGQRQSLGLALGPGGGGCDQYQLMQLKAEL